ncbi:MAG: hypothetical protein M3Y27_25920, partial [Acidobacteriota bacterium]|nr:hypothetical protein [Acidobacteriota bacterium]
PLKNGDVTTGARAAGRSFRYSRYCRTKKTRSASEARLVRPMGRQFPDLGYAPALRVEYCSLTLA